MKREAIQAGPEPSPIAAYLSDAIRVGPLLFPSGILHPTEPSSDPYFSPTKVQTDLIFKRLEAALRAGGSSLDRIVKIATYHRSIDELALYIDRRDAFLGRHAKAPMSAFECGLVRANARIEIELIGLTDDWPEPPKPIIVDTLPRMPAGSPHAIEAGPYVFTSSIMATDFASGVVKEALVPKGLPYFHSAMKEQTKWVLDALGKILKACGGTLQDVVKAQVVLTNLADFLQFDEIWRGAFSPTFPARTVVEGSLPVPGCLVGVELIAVSQKADLRPRVVEAQNVPRPSTAESLAIRAGDLIFTGGLMPTDYQEGVASDATAPEASRHYSESMKAQVRYVLRNLDNILRACDSSLQNVVRVGAYHTNIAADLLPAMEIRRETFPSQPPASTTIEVPRLLVPEGRFMFDAIAVAAES